MDGGAFLGGIIKGIAGAMPQDDPDVKIFNAQTKVTDLQKKLAKEYETVGKEVMDSEAAANYPQYASSIAAIKQDISNAQIQIDTLKREKEEAERMQAEEEDRFTCKSCGHINPEGTNFCQECGSRLQAQAEPVCPACGKVNRPGVRFCGECGSKLD